MSDKHEIEFFVAMNEDGDIELAHDSDDARGLLRENVGGDACRIVKVKMTMAAPVIEEVEINVPDTAGEIEMAAE